MTFSMLYSAPVRRALLGLILVAVLLFPAGSAPPKARACRHRTCPARGAIIWRRRLTGSWLAGNGPQGTVYEQGQAYAAIGSGTAAIGFGLTLDAFDAATGVPKWTTTLAGVPAGSAIISVRAWPGVVTAGVDVRPANGAVVADAPGMVKGAMAATMAKASPAGREEFVLDAATGRQIAKYPASWLGGAVSASPVRTVVVGSNAVTSYDNATGAIRWRDLTGAAGQAWQADGGSLYVTVSADGMAGTAPVKAVRKIDMTTGAERLIQPADHSFAGLLSGAIDGVLLFSGPAGLSMYSEKTGRLTAFRAGAVPEVFDPVQQVLYVDLHGTLIGINPLTGQDDRGTAYPGPPGTYGVRAGVALGLDTGANGAAWGYSIAKKHVVWTTRPLPWPHFFVDLSGIGGSIDPVSALLLLVACARAGGPAPSGGPGGGAAQICLRPVLVVVRR